ncbi:MAG: CBS domain-containing protein [Methylococcaceae bacterium]|nr:CBS domain-containing protein [Methylococcaceae bacterium]MCI0734049.1 CBS domain-containing protein [Methylococcaceae bacterium]
MSRNGLEEHGGGRSWIDRISHFLTGEPQDREDLIEVLNEARERHLIDSEALAMIEGVLQVSEMRVRDIMVPRVQMVVVPKDAELETIFPLVTESGHSRFPVIGDDKSEVVGVLMAKDLLKKMREDSGLLVQDILCPARFVPESKRLNVLLKEFREHRSHMAIVVDEYGNAAGLVTIEDVLEQIVGEIEDEHDFVEEEYIFQRSEHDYRLKALMPLDDFNDYFGTDFRSEEFDTVGGLVLHHMGHVPERGEKVTLGRFQFTVLRADTRRVHLLGLQVNKDFDEEQTMQGFAG